MPFSREVSKTRAVRAGDWERENCCCSNCGKWWWRAEATVLRWVISDMFVWTGNGSKIAKIQKL